MDLATAVGTAAAVVQLAEFTGKLIQKTYSFFAALAGASAELDALHAKVKLLSDLIENTRVLACSYQNSQLALGSPNQNSFGLLAQSLTVCSIDLQQLNKALQNPIDRTQKRIIRVKRRVRHVLDESAIKRSVLLLEGHISLISGLISCINMHNDLVIHGSIDQVAALVEELPYNLELTTIAAHEQNSDLIMDRLDNILGKLSLVGREVPMNATIVSGGFAENAFRQAVGESTMFQESSSIHSRALDGSFVEIDDLLSALDVFVPAFRSGLQILDRDGELRASKEAVRWLSSEFHHLLAEIHGLAARSYAGCPQPENLQEQDQCIGIAMLPKRFQRRPARTEPIRTKTSRNHTFIPADVAASRAFNRTNRYISCSGRVTHSQGTLLANFEGTHWSQHWPVGEADSGRFCIAFIPKPTLKVLGIAVTFMKEPEHKSDLYHALLTTFNVVPLDAPIIRAIQDGDRGVSQVLQSLKAKDIWAGDRDENGRSLLSYAVNSGSRDMVALLLRMGAHPQDVKNIEELQFEPVQRKYHLNWHS